MGWRDKCRGLWRRRWLRRLSGLLILSPFLLWGLGNLFFSTSLGTGLLANRVEEKIGFPCEIGSVRWTPWNGVLVKDVSVLAPRTTELDIGHPLAKIDEVRVDGKWKSLMAGEAGFLRA